MEAEDIHIGFLITSPYQVFHYKWIEKSFDNTTIIIEERDRSFGLTESFLEEHFPNRPLEWVPQKHLKRLDGRFDAIVCQTPILPLCFFEKTRIIAQQYSLAKESYQYGVWRSQADLNLMYGPYSVDKVSGFCNAVAVGNPLLDPFFSGKNNNFNNPLDISERLTILYMPTYGDLSSLPRVIPKLNTLEHDVIIKLHHGEERDITSSLASNCTVVYSDTDPVDLLKKANCVISDYSGAVFDAIYAGLPVILTQGKISPLSKDFSRLSDDEKNSKFLNNIAEHWNLETPFEEVLSRASAKLNNKTYRRFVEDFFVNPGCAGDACAAEIRNLIESDRNYKFDHLQVRNSIKNYILDNRKLRSEIKKLRSRKLILSKGFRKKFIAKTKKKLAQNRFLRQCVKYIKPLMYSSKTERKNETNKKNIKNELGVTPRQRRSEILSLIKPYFDNSSVELVVKELPDSSGPICAILNEEKKKFHKMLLTIAKDYPVLEVRLGKGASIKSKKKLTSLKFSDIYDTHYLVLGIPDRFSRRKNLTDWFLEIQFVESREGKYTSLHLRSNKVDWTEEFNRTSYTNKQNLIIFPSSGDNSAIGQVDAVYTWVDSSDPAWQKSYEKYCKKARSKLRSANNEERYINRDELRYSLRSLWMYAPFIRHIYIVTANQIPKWLNQECEWISLVSHDEIFPDNEMLPTFNSHAIEACLHRIPNLSENFIYFNDDVFLGREVTKEDFFTKSGLPKNRFSPTQYIYEGIPDTTAIPTHWAAVNANQLIQRDFGFTFDRKLKHVPFPLKKSTLEEIEKRYSEEITKTRFSKFRSSGDLAIPSMFAPFYSIATGKGNEWPNIAGEYIYADTGRSDIFRRLNRIAKNRPKFFCLNATKHREIDFKNQKYILESFLREMYPFKAPFEKNES